MVLPLVFRRDSPVDHTVLRIDLRDPELALLPGQDLFLFQQADQRLDHQGGLFEFPLQFLDPLVRSCCAETFPTLVENRLGSLEILPPGRLRDVSKVNRLRLFWKKEVK